MDRENHKGRALNSNASAGGCLGSEENGTVGPSGISVARVCAGEGKFALEAVLVVTPRGITVTAVSPEFAHVGATAQAIPRPEPGRTATVSILAVPCHRDEIPAHDIAAALATRFGMPCVASTGFHVEDATSVDLQRVLDVTHELIERLEEVAESMLGGTPVHRVVVGCRSTPARQTTRVPSM